MIVTLGGRTFERREKRGGAPSPDPRWSYRDVNGHHHAWVLERGRPPSLPTCRAMQFLELFQGSEVRTLCYECARCGVPIEPGRIIETLREYLIDGHEVTEAEFLRFVDWAALPPTFWGQSSQTVGRVETAQTSAPLVAIIYRCPACQDPLVLVEDDDPLGPLPSFPTTISDLYRCPTHGLWRRSLRDGFTPVDPYELS